MSKYRFERKEAPPKICLSIQLSHKREIQYCKKRTFPGVGFLGCTPLTSGRQKHQGASCLQPIDQYEGIFSSLVSDSFWTKDQRFGKASNLKTGKLCHKKELHVRSLASLTYSSFKKYIPTIHEVRPCPKTWEYKQELSN